MIGRRLEMAREIDALEPRALGEDLDIGKELAAAEVELDERHVSKRVEVFHRGAGERERFQLGACDGAQAVHGRIVEDESLERHAGEGRKIGYASVGKIEVPQ